MFPKIRGFTLISKSHKGFTLIRTRLCRNLVNVQAFTLIELLVVIALIGILAGLLLVSMQGARASARDAQRQADLENIKSALEMFKSTCGEYPPTGSVPINGSALSAACNGPSITVLNSTPKDPISTKSYTYSRLSKTSYTLTAKLESGIDLVVTP